MQASTWLWALACASVLAACAPTEPTQPADPAALREWMAEQRLQFNARNARSAAAAAGAGTVPTALPAIEPVAAGRGVFADPFDARRLSGLPPAPGQRPERADPPLLAHPLSALRMVGSLRRGDEVVALVQADVQIYQVPVGAFLGKNQAQVLRITEEGITLQEPPRGLPGQSPARTVTLPLQGR
ncbi:pilus assembly protein PilP [Hylemonella gracilis]|uniref:Putative type 4 fimbrial biogenesis protein n=1 Tax=Hylemonella gracilis ATCC 19624 TaxID=887062 RepID=F3KS42_9BURK|nr:pilus assembly protein PilP [Hylemonella gracilis]EGI77402.1 putative type 4 fimbrial biogenesis protein [Hylemonella gracilis ATCC 19624]